MGIQGKNMSGDVQPRKRQDKKRKKGDLTVEESRGSTVSLGEGDVFIHRDHEYETQGNRCSQITMYFFTFLLIGWTIFVYRSSLYSNTDAVVSRYSSVLEGFLEDSIDDDHYDEHTLELKHKDDNEENSDPGYFSQEDEENVSEEDEYEGHDDEAEEENASQEIKAAESDEDEYSYYHMHLSKYDKYHKEIIDVDNDDIQSNENEDINQQINNDEDMNVNINEKIYMEYGFEVDKDDYDEDDTVENSEEDTNIVNDIEHNNDIDGSFENNDDENNNGAQNIVNAKGDRESEPDITENDGSDAQSEENEQSNIEYARMLSDNNVDNKGFEIEINVYSSDKDDQYSEENDDNYLSVEDIEKETDDEVDNFDDNEEILESEEDVEHITVPTGKPFDEVEDDSAEQIPGLDSLAEEEEYERRQEELRQEEEKVSHIWLKLIIGAALLVATQAVVRRATVSRDPIEFEDISLNEERAVADSPITVLPESKEMPASATTKLYQQKGVECSVDKKSVIPLISNYTPSSEQESEDEETDELDGAEDINNFVKKNPTDEELFSDDEFEEHELDENNIAKVAEEEEPEDIEIVDDEQLDEDEYDDEEISDVDDTELLSRLEEKYGRIPDPERPYSKHKEAGNSVNDEWPGEPSDAYWRGQLDLAENEFQQGHWKSCEALLVKESGLQNSGRARWLIAQCLDQLAESQRDNRMLSKAIDAYLHLLKMSDRLTDEKLLKVAVRALDRIKFRGTYLTAEPVYKLLIRRFPNNSKYRNELTVSFLMANRADLAEVVVNETLKLWPKNRLALAHRGFILKTYRKNLEEAVEAFEKALEGDTGPANEPRYYFHWGDALLILGRYKEAHEVHKRGAKLGHFLSSAQRSLYNHPKLEGQPWWDVTKTPYSQLAKALEASWREILKEGEAASALYEQEKEGLKERGEWSQLDLFVRGQEIPNRCKVAPVTCRIVRSMPGGQCTRGQVKFSSMASGTHVRPHVGPTNCRLRMHLGLKNTKDTYLRVHEETREWQEGKVLLFDDSFEHEVWHNGTGTRLVLIVDVWHPSLTQREKRLLPPI